MTREVRLMVGISGAGKSTWIGQEIDRLERELMTTCVISWDYIRRQLLKPEDDYFANERRVFSQFVREINESLKLGIDFVFVDATHINPASRDKILSKLRPDPNTSLVLEVLPIDVETAIKRNNLRVGFARVSEEAIRKMNKDFVMPTQQEFVNNTYGFKQVILKCHGK